MVVEDPHGEQRPKGAPVEPRGARLTDLPCLLFVLIILRLEIRDRPEILGARGSLEGAALG